MLLSVYRLFVGLSVARAYSDISRQAEARIDDCYMYHKKA